MLSQGREITPTLTYTIYDKTATCDKRCRALLVINNLLSQIKQIFIELTNFVAGKTCQKLADNFGEISH